MKNSGQEIKDAASQIIKELLNKNENLHISDSSYLFSYPKFIDYFKENKIDANTLTIGVHFIYGWMPTIFNYNGKSEKEIKRFNNLDIELQIDNVVPLLNNIKEDLFELTNDNYKTIQHLLNNSLVGASKLLHFINPNKYAIWDSNVLAFLMTKKELVSLIKFTSTINSISNYKKYLNLLTDLSQDNEFSNLRNKVKNELKQLGYKYEISDFRVLELIMFIKGREMKTYNL